jgi:ABC-type transport system involved in multi-copper enzyme maturation permease subunit
MNCLPIVDRELRVAARKRSTFWLRVAAAGTALLIGGCGLALGKVSGTGTTSMGSSLFHLLTWLCLAAGLFAGLFFTSDCLSEEKREGTLGLLFLTDLRGYDVVLGKLLATSLRGFYALLAVLPIMAVTLFMGGVSVDQYWRSCLALVNALFVSLAAGMAVSALSRDSQKALTATLLVLLLVALGGPVADASVAAARGRSYRLFWTLSSPGFVLVAASGAGRPLYWTALGITQGIGWGLLALACALAPHTWQDRKRAGASTAGSWAYAWRYGGPSRRLRLRSKLLEGQPVAWLTSRERWQSRGLWALAVLAVGCFVTVLVKSPFREAWILWSYVGLFFTLLLYLWAASQGCRFFVEARRSGLLELMLVAPLSSAQIVRGQWQGLLRMFGLPVALLLGVHVAAATLSHLGLQRMTAQTSTVTTSVVTNQSGTVTSRSTVVGTRIKILPTKGGTNTAPATPAFQAANTPRSVAMAVGAAGATAVNSVANLLALCWFGLWMGMTSRSANLATLKTFLFVLVIPGLVISFGSSMVLGMVMAGFAFRAGQGQPGAWLAWWPLLSTLLGAGLSVGTDAGFILWSRKKLYSSLRAQAASSLGQPGLAAPPPAPTVTPAPPLTTAP